MSSVIRFIEERPSTDDQILNVKYAWPVGDTPQIGDRVESDGSDPQFEEGVWEVVGRFWQVGIHGPDMLIVSLDRRG